MRTAGWLGRTAALIAPVLALAQRGALEDRGGPTAEDGAGAAWGGLVALVLVFLLALAVVLLLANSRRRRQRGPPTPTESRAER